MQSLKRYAYDVCPECGAHLDHGEGCDCKRIARRARAICPAFLARYRRGEKIGVLCKVHGSKELHQYDKPDALLRDEHYADYCCERYRLCPMWQSLAKEQEKRA